MKRSKNTFTLYIAFFCAMNIMVSGCRSKKALVDVDNTISRSVSDIENAVAKHNFDYDWFAIESSIKVSTPDQGFSGKAYIRIRKDSIIWSVMKKLSAEGVRILATEDSYSAINRLDRTYQKGNTREAFDRFQLDYDFADVQDMMAGLIIKDLEDKQTFQEEGKWYMSGNYNGNSVKYHIDENDLTIRDVKIVDYRRRSMHIEYDDYRILDTGQHVPFYRKYTMPFDENTNSEIIFSVKKIEVDVPKKTKFSIPRHYEQVDF